MKYVIGGTIICIQFIRLCTTIRTITSTNIFLTSQEALIEKNSKIVPVLMATPLFLLNRLWWLINIRSGHLLYHQESFYFIEPYYSSRFARYFRYSQLYVGSPNTLLWFWGKLFEGARGWYLFATGCMGFHFVLPQKTPNRYMSLRFCFWYYSINTIVTSFLINHSRMKEIKAFYS